MLDKLNNSGSYLETIGKDIEALAEKISQKLSTEGRVIFVGAGLSSEMARIIIDELWFNFQIQKGKFISLTAARNYVEDTDTWKELEEVSSTSIFELNELGLNSNDIVIGLSSSGKTQYVVSAIKYAHDIGCETAAVTDIDNSLIGENADYVINTKFGTPPIVGLNAAEGGTIQKIILDLLIYNAMSLSGRIYENHLVFMQPVSAKIKSYCISTIVNLLKTDEASAKELLTTASGRLEVALIMGLKSCTPRDAETLLEGNDYNFYRILE